MPYPMKKRESNMGNITETDYFEKLAQDKLYELQMGMKAIQDKIAKKGIVHIDHDDLRDILDITVVCLGEER
tara:strand:- start:463 stop:678 length:216 start_codon:yes stop_codon:yes gene_type:complete